MQKSKTANKPKKKPQTTTKRPTKKPKDASLRKEIYGFILVFAGLFLLYCYYAANAGIIGGFISGSLMRLMGATGSLILTVAIILHGLLLLMKFKPFLQYHGSSYLYILVLNAVTIAGFGFRDMNLYTITDVHFFELIWTQTTPGGFVGQLLSKIYVTLLSPVGAWLFVILVSIISFILIFRKGIVESVRNKTNDLKNNQKTERKKTAKPKQNKKDSDDLIVRISQENDKLFIKKEAQSKSRFQNIKRKGSPLEDFLSEQKDDPQRASVKKISPIEVFVNNANMATENDKEDIQKESVSRKGKVIESNDALKTVSKSQRSKDKYIFPPYSLLDSTVDKNQNNEKQEILANASLLEKTLSDFSIDAKVSEICMGPTVTRYELQLQPGIRVSKVVNLSDDIAMSLAAQRVRIEAPIPGKAAIGIEVPNKETSVVKLSHIIRNKKFTSNTSPLAVALGKKLSGEMLLMDITKLPHLLIAGATGSGKSVCINTIIMSILYHSSPDDVRMILIDPKMVELNVYNEIPHLLIPVVTDPKLASGALNWAVREMTSRYEAFAENKVRDIGGYNKKMEKEGEDKFSHIVLIIDELSDLMMVSAQQVETAICRLAQLARAAGIHLVLATQRPSVNVITGLIKANIPSRISFAVTSQVDSRTILDMGGAEKLLGQGDMLYYPAGLSKPIRAQCAYISEKEVERVVDFIKKKRTAEYDNEVIEDIKSGKESVGLDDNDSAFEDELLPQAMQVAFNRGQISTSMIQRKLRIGYARAGRIIDEMEERGYVSGPNGSKPRELLISPEEFAQAEEQG